MNQSLLILHGRKHRGQNRLLIEEQRQCWGPDPRNVRADGEARRRGRVYQHQVHGSYLRKLLIFLKFFDLSALIKLGVTIKLIRFQITCAN